MEAQIKHAQSKVEFFKDAYATSGDTYYFDQAKNWINHVADLKKEHEQQLIKQ